MQVFSFFFSKYKYKARFCRANACVFGIKLVNTPELTANIIQGGSKCSTVRNISLGFTVCESTGSVTPEVPYFCSPCLFTFDKGLWLHLTIGMYINKENKSMEVVV